MTINQTENLAAKSKKLRAPQPGALFYSIPDSAVLLAMSEWSIKDFLRRGILRARKSGRRTLIEGESIQTYAASLPPAQFAPPAAPRRNKQTAAA